MEIKSKTPPFDHYEAEPDVERWNKILVRVTVATMIIFCGIVWYAMSLLEVIV